MIVTALYIVFKFFSNYLNCDFLYCFGAIFYCQLISGFSDQQDYVAAKCLSSVFTVPLSPPVHGHILTCFSFSLLVL